MTRGFGLSGTPTGKRRSATLVVFPSAYVKFSVTVTDPPDRTDSGSLSSANHRSDSPGTRTTNERAGMGIETFGLPSAGGVVGAAEAVGVADGRRLPLTDGVTDEAVVGGGVGATRETTTTVPPPSAVTPVSVTCWPLSLNSRNTSGAFVPAGYSRAYLTYASRTAIRP